MTFDSEEQRKFFAEMIGNCTFPGHMVPFVAAQIHAVEVASIEGVPVSGGMPRVDQRPDDFDRTYAEPAAPVTDLKPGGA